MAVAYDTKGAGVGQNFLSGSWNHTTTGSNIYMILVVSMKSPGATTVSTATYNSVSLAQISSQAQSTNVLTEVWALKAAATGTNSLALTLSGAVDTCAQSFTFTGVDQTTPTGTIAKTSGAGGAPSLAGSGTATGMFLTLAGGDVTASTLTLGTSGGTKQSDQTVSGGNGHLGVATIPGGASITDSWSWSVFVDWTQIIVPMIAAAAATSVPSGLALLGVGNGG